MAAGFSEEEIRAVMGENAIRLLSRGLVPLANLPPEETQEEAEETA